MLWFGQLYAASRRLALGVAPVAAGVVLELLQALTSTRSSGPLEILANLAGLISGCLLGRTCLATALQAVKKNSPGALPQAAHRATR